MSDLGAKLESIDSRSLQERVYDEIRHALLQGGFAVGQSLTIRGLAAAMGTSEMPVREALKRLIAEKMVVQLSNRTFQVPALAWDEFREILELRLFIEGKAVEKAMAHADSRLTIALARANETMRRALRQGENKLVLRANNEFHFLIYRASGSSVLVDMIEHLWMRSGPYLAEALSTIPNAREVFLKATEAHERLITALSAGDTARALAALTEDLGETAGWYEQQARAEAHIEAVQSSR